jgi:hypothetical protein
VRLSEHRFTKAAAVADAVLFEGYVLYPYRASARKNQFRWQFGVLMPGACAAGLGERDRARTEVVAEVGLVPVLDVRVRALQVQERRVEGPDGNRVGSLDAGDRVWTSFDEAVEHAVDIGEVTVDELVESPRAVDVVWDGGEEVEELPDCRGRVVRTRWPVHARVTVGAAWVRGPSAFARVTVEVANMTDVPACGTREEAVRHSLVAVHTLLALGDGTFVSMLDPPAPARDAVAACRSEGTYPVLIDDDVVLSSPIIMYDRPAVAPESTGDMFDATEIDEILALRVLTLTDEEKREARGTDPRAAAVVDRWESLDAASLERLHGTFRTLADLGMEPPSGPPEEQPLPWWDPGVDAGFDPHRDTVWVGDREVGRGARVRLRPSRRADAQDLFFAGREATVEGVFHDVGGDVHLAVVVADAEGADVYAAHGRYLYFSPDEVEVLP